MYYYMTVSLIAISRIVNTIVSIVIVIVIVIIITSLLRCGSGHAEADLQARREPAGHAGAAADLPPRGMIRTSYMMNMIVITSIIIIDNGYYDLLLFIL